MASSALFDAIAEALEQTSDLDRMEARGTLRLALRETGLKPESVTSEQAQAVVQFILPDMLADRGVEQPEQICGSLAGVATATPGATQSAEDLFRRVDSDRGLG